MKLDTIKQFPLILRCTRIVKKIWHSIHFFMGYTFMILLAKVHQEGFFFIYNEISTNINHLSNIKRIRFMVPKDEIGLCFVTAINIKSKLYQLLSSDGCVLYTDILYCILYTILYYIIYWICFSITYIFFCC